MDNVDKERKLQDRVVSWLEKDLGYTYMGNLEDQDNKAIKSNLLEDYLRRRGYTATQIKQAIMHLEKAANNQANSLYQINKEVYSLLRYGLQGVKDEERKRPTLHYIDWAHPLNNDFAVAEEVSVLRYDGRTHKRPDVVLYVNGIALGGFELKRSCVSVGEGIRQQLQNQKQENIRNFFSTAQFLFAGNEGEVFAMVPF